MHCWHCQYSSLEAFLRHDVCPQCGRDTRVCLNCTFYDPSAAGACREMSAERVIDKEKANFCDWFRPGSRQSHAKGSREAAERLFAKKGGSE